jgi:hypothetical protein
VVFEAYMDDSVTPGGTFVLGGYVASAGAWAEFSKERELLLPLATRSKGGRFRFKMSEMTRRMDDVRAFYTVIEKFVALKLSCKIDIADLELRLIAFGSSGYQYYTAIGRTHILCVSEA